MSSKAWKVIFETLAAIVIMVVVLGFAGFLHTKAHLNNSLINLQSASTLKTLPSSVSGSTDSNTSTTTGCGPRIAMPCPPTDDPPQGYPKPQEPPTPGGCNTHRPCPPTGDDSQPLQRTPPQETGTGCTSTTVCPASNDTCTKEDGCGANPANNDEDNPSSCQHIWDNCTQRAPDGN